jgi:hypothetical protein
MKSILLLLAGLTLWAGVSVVRGEPWWVSYEADLFPEELPGWTRMHASTPAQRWIEEGVLSIDSRASPLIYDYYEMVFDHPVDPHGPNELFVLFWRLKIDDDINHDAGIAFTSDAVGPYEFYRVAFNFTEDTIISEDGQHASFEAGVFHEFEVRSSDMRAYVLYIDGAPAVQGLFTEVFGPARLTWGDGGYASSSLTEWDYVRLGVVVPEPSGRIAVLLLLAMLRRRRR